MNIQQYYSKNRLTISEYYQIIKQKLESNDYTTPNDIDFSKYSVEEFLKEIMKLKN